MQVEDIKQSAQNSSTDTTSRTSYEPSKNVRDAYLLLRKNGKQLTGLKLPGLFDYSQGHDKTLFYTGFAFETLATLATWWFVSSRYESSIWTILGGLIIVIFVDYFLCGLHQVFVVKKRSIKENKKLLFIQKLSSKYFLDAPYEDYINILEAKQPDPKNWHIAFIILILCLVLFRLISFISIALGTTIFYFFLKRSGVMAYSGLALICFFYIGIAYIHINHTGYAIGSWWKQYLEKSDKLAFFDRLATHQHIPKEAEYTINLNEFYEELINSPSPHCKRVVSGISTADISRGFETDSLILGNPTNNNARHTPYYPHQLLEIQNSPESCMLKSIGFLDDQSLFKMIDVQKTDIAKCALAIYGLAIQLDLLETERA